jgi:energy-coupling factor transporter transmembrane protein EcfT
MYPWLVFLHIVGVFGFLLSHGASASVSFALKKERNIERVRALLELSARSYGLMYTSLLILLISGIITGIMGHWWKQVWFWLAIVLLIVIILAMTFMGSNIYGRARKATGLPYMERGKPQPAVEVASDAEIDAFLSKGNPMVLTIIGFGGIIFIAWLMMFKPF